MAKKLDLTVKNLTALLGVVVVVLLASCGGSDREEEIDPAKVTADSLAQSIIDNDSIDWYINEYQIADVREEASGIRYALLEEGNGEAPDPNDIVSVTYLGKFLNGKAFDTNSEQAAKDADIYVENRNYVPLRFNYTENGSTLSSSFLASFRQGLTEVLNMKDTEGKRMFTKGSRAVLFLPSALAYGTTGDQVSNLIDDTIPPNTVILFEFTLVTFRP